VLPGVHRTAIALALTASLTGCMPPWWGASALLHPSRSAIGDVPALAHRDIVIEGDGVTLRGWLFPAQVRPRVGALVYLHGAADNRASGAWLAERLVRAGWDVIAYDSRAQGESTGDACTYGFREKRDLSRVLDRLGVERALVVGVSLGAAVALQAAAEDPRIAGVVSVATFSSLQAIARERAPALACEGQIRKALALAGEEGGFDPAAVSPEAAARRVSVPVLVLHGAADEQTRPEHSRRVFAALAGPKRLVLVEGAGHDDALQRGWGEVEAWIAEAARGGRGGAAVRP